MSILKQVVLLRKVLSQLSKAEQVEANMLINTWANKGRLSQLQQVQLDRLVARVTEGI